MQKMAGGRGTGASRLTSARAWDAPVAGERSPEARRSRTLPVSKATISSPLTSPACGSEAPGARKVASFMAGDPTDTRRMTGFRTCPVLSVIVGVGVTAIQAAAAATTTTYRSFADATRSVLDLLERYKPGCGLFMAHLDRGQFIHRIVDVRGGADYGLRSNQARPLADAFCSHMADGNAPRLCGDVGSHDVYNRLPMQQRAAARSYIGVPLELSDGTRVGSLAGLSRRRNAFNAADEQLFIMLARVLASELERESNARDLRRFNDMLRDQAKGMGAIGRVAKALAAGDDARQSICEAACEVMDAPVAFLL